MASIKEVILPSGNAYDLKDAITHVVLTQAEYDALVVAGTVDNDKIYFITDGDAPAASASDVTYSNTQSGLSATNVQDAVDELVSSDSRTLAGLTDTKIQTPTINQLLGYNGTKWENKSITIPTKTSDLTNDSDFIKSSDLALVATSGNYNDLYNRPIDITGVLSAGQTSITLSSNIITLDSTIEVFNDLDVPYNSKTVSVGSIILTFDAQASDMNVKVRIS